MNEAMGLGEYDWSAATATATAAAATASALLFIVLFHFARLFSSRFHPSPSPILPVPRISVSEVVSDDDLKFLIQNLENPSSYEKWEHVIQRSTNLVSYTAKCCKPKDAPLKYLSTTLFEKCSAEFLRDFYMDNSYRKKWDNTITDHVQLQLDKTKGIEVGRTIKKFPLLTAREYVLAWRLWEGSDGAFYCFTKECDHPLEPEQKKYVRVRYFRSGWRIRQVPGKNASEIKMFHQEDAGLNVEMAKLAFAKGIWSYVLKMERALRTYSTACHLRNCSSATSDTLIQKVPPGLHSLDRVDCASTCIAPTMEGRSSVENKFKKSSGRALADSFLILGGLVWLSRGRAAFGAKVAVAYFLTKLHQRNDSPGQSRTA